MADSYYLVGFSLAGQSNLGWVWPIKFDCGYLWSDGLELVAHSNWMHGPDQGEITILNRCTTVIFLARAWQITVTSQRRGPAEWNKFGLWITVICWVRFWQGPLSWGTPWNGRTKIDQICTRSLKVEENIFEFTEFTNKKFCNLQKSCSALQTFVSWSLFVIPGVHPPSGPHSIQQEEWNALCLLGIGM